MANPPTDEPLLALDQIQGNVIPGFLKDHQHFFFFSIIDGSAARKCLAKLHARLSTAAAVFASHKEWKAERKRLGREPDPKGSVFRNVALSASGLRKLTNNKDVDDFADVAFKVGLAERSTYIGDPEDQKESGHASGWKFGGPTNPVDVVLIIASDNVVSLEDEARKLTAEFSANGMRLVHEDHGDVNAAPSPGHEQFGFKDGISHPAVRGHWNTDPYDYVAPRTFPQDKAFDSVRADFAGPGKRLVWPGHFIFGYGRQRGDDPRTYDPADQPKGPAWAKDGSLLVYRRLRQDPGAFSNFVAAAAQALAKKFPGKAPDKQRLAALLVGRWPSGTPVSRSPDKDNMLTGDPANYFAFANAQTPALPGDSAPNPADPDGHFCPLGAHIRKVNPRDQATDLGFAQRTPPKSLLRRGITYASRSDDKGLIFVAYQGSIVDQFEFLMKQWINQPNRPQDRGGHDPLLALGGARSFYLPIGKGSQEIPVSGAFVVPTGGEYFFSPSIAFFQKTLAAVTKK